MAENLDLAAARLFIREAGARLEQSGRLSNPELESELRPNVNGREGVAAFGLTQRFPLTDRLRRERAVSRAEINAAEAEVRERERQLAADVALGLADWLALDAQRDVRQRQLEQSRALARTARKIADSGEAPALDAAQHELTAGQLSIQLHTLDRERANQLASLRRQLNLAASEPLDITGNLRVIADSPLTPPAATGPRPDLQLAAARREIAHRESELTLAQRWQDLGVGLVAEVQRAEDIPAGRLNDQFVGLRLALPLPFWNRNQGRIHEAAAAAERRQLEHQALVQRIQTEQAAAADRHRTAVTIERALRQGQLPAARRLEEELHRLKEQGQASFTDLARAREKRLQVELDHVEALRELLRTQLQLQTAYGQFPRFPSPP